MRPGIRARDPGAMSLRCFLVDDSPHFVSAARELLEREGIAVVGVASTGDEALRQVPGAAPDVVLVDVDLGDESGFDLVRRFEGELAGDRARVVLISTYDREDLEDLLSAVPSVAFLPKTQLSAGAIRRILDAQQ
jgi:DNA-binding NarL/FixJ family response regulator